MKTQNKKPGISSDKFKYLFYFSEKESKMSHHDEFQIRGHYKLADVLLTDERLLLIVERLGISLGFGDKTIEEVCTEYELNLSLVLIVMNVFRNHSFVIKEELDEEMLPGLINYLKRGHHYYLNEKLPFISELIDRFIKNTDNPDTVLLQTFFDEYASEVTEHINLEDTTVFPYIQSLYSYSKSGKPDGKVLKYSIDDFVEHHSDIEEKLEDLTQLLIKHFPPTKDRFYRNMILLELFGLQYDINDHSRIENHLLAPLVRKLEVKTR